jgi:7-cyano-7-deazaguanine synthase
MADTSALVLFSGGQDSTVCLAWALQRYERVETVGFRYGQRHIVELGQRGVIRSKLSSFWDAERRLGPDAVLDLPALQNISDTALTRETEITFAATGLPTTFVPGRNLLFLTYAAALGYRRGIATLVGGMCETDFSGYPDCRNATAQALSQTLSLGLDTQVTIETPLMFIDKAGTWELASQIGGQKLVDVIIEDTHTCYLGDRAHRHPWGYGCGKCPACELRSKGWTTWQARTT